MGILSNLFGNNEPPPITCMEEELIIIKKILATSLSTKYVLESLVANNFYIISETVDNHVLKGKFGSVAFNSDEDRQITSLLYTDLNGTTTPLIQSLEGGAIKLLFKREELEE